MIRAAVVGWAWRTPMGGSVGEVVARLLAGERAAVPTATLMSGSYAATTVAPIPSRPAPSRHARFLRRLGLHAVEAATEAIADAAGAGRAVERGARLGLYSAVGGLRAHWEDLMGPLARQREDGAGAWERGLGEIHPFWMLRHLSNNVHGLVATDLDARGDGATFGGGNAGAQALAAAIRSLACGAVDAALVVAHDSLLEPETLVELAARRAAAAEPAGEHVSPPYDEAAAGFVPGEAAAALVLVRPDEADGRARALVAAATGADGAPAEPDAPTIARAAAPLADGVAVIDGAGRAVPALDAAERGALAGLAPAGTPLVATSAALGQLGAATAVVQVIALGELLARATLPAIAGMQRPAAGPLAPVIRTATAAGARVALGIGTAAPGLTGVVRVERAP